MEEHNYEEEGSWCRQIKARTVKGIVELVISKGSIWDDIPPKGVDSYAVVTCELYTSDLYRSKIVPSLIGINGFDHFFPKVSIKDKTKKMTQDQFRTFVYYLSIIEKLTILWEKRTPLYSNKDSGSL